MNTDDRITLLALCRIPKISWYLVAREAQRPDGLRRLVTGILTEESKEARETKKVLEKHLSEIERLREEAAAIVGSTQAEGTKLTTVLDDDYPLNLRSIFNAPPFLFYRGELQAHEDARSVAVVGTRQASPDGLKRASKMARLLAEHRVTVLSGLARGIDMAAHEAALNAGGRTVAVLGSGLRKVYPPENAPLADRIAESGAVVSQFWPDSPPTQFSFPMRNITMSGMGQGTVVIEASATSGAKMQARLALEHGKKVFLIRDLVGKQKWAQAYLKRGAIQVANVEQIIDRLQSPEVIQSKAERVYQLDLSLA